MGMGNTIYMVYSQIRSEKVEGKLFYIQREGFRKDLEVSLVVYPNLKGK